MSEKVEPVVAQLSVLRAEVDRLVSTCMNDEGFPFFPRTSREHYAHLSTLFAITPYFITEDEAMTGGYPRRVALPPRPAMDGKAYFDGLTDIEHDAYADAHLGEQMSRLPTTSGVEVSVPVSGCVGKANERVFGSIENFLAAEATYYDLQMMTNEILTLAEQDDDFSKARDKWVACMQQEGHAYASPSAAREAARGDRSDDAQPSETEIAVATADARCQAKASLQRANRRAVLKAQRRAVDKEQQLFLAWDELMDKVKTAGFSDLERKAGEVAK